MKKAFIEYYVLYDPISKEKKIIIPCEWNPTQGNCDYDPQSRRGLHIKQYNPEFHIRVKVAKWLGYTLKNDDNTTINAR